MYNSTIQYSLYFNALAIQQTYRGVLMTKILYKV